MGHLFSAAQAAFKGEVEKAWKLYVKLLKLAWAGKIEELANELKEHALRVGKPPEKCSDDDPRKILARAIDYIDKNRDKMDYPRYRRQGLPIGSAPVESLIKEMNLPFLGGESPRGVFGAWRFTGELSKGTEKFWIREGMEAILQVRAAHLSEDGRAEAHFAKRDTTAELPAKIFSDAAGKPHNYFHPSRPPLRGGDSRSSDPRTWVSLSTALEAIVRGPGFFLTVNPLIGFLTCSEFARGMFSLDRWPILRRAVDLKEGQDGIATGRPSGRPR